MCTAGKHPASLLKGIRNETTILIHPNLPPHLSQAPLPQAEQETFCTKPNSAALMPPPVLGTAVRSRDMQEIFNVLSAGPGAWSVLPGGAERQLLHLFPLWEAHFGHPRWRKASLMVPQATKNTKQSLFLPGVYSRVTRSREGRQGYRGCSVNPEDPLAMRSISAG